MEETKLEGPIDASDARELIAGTGEIRVFDIRNPEAREDGFVPGSTQVPEDELEERVRASGGEKIVLVCEDGGRSGELAEKLRGDGTEVTSIKGGMQAWLAEDGPVQPRDDFKFKGPGGEPGT